MTLTINPKDIIIKIIPTCGYGRWRVSFIRFWVISGTNWIIPKSIPNISGRYCICSRNMTSRVRSIEHRCPAQLNLMALLRRRIRYKVQLINTADDASRYHLVFIHSLRNIALFIYSPFLELIFTGKSYKYIFKT